MKAPPVVNLIIAHLKAAPEDEMLTIRELAHAIERSAERIAHYSTLPQLAKFRRSTGGLTATVLWGNPRACKSFDKLNL
jgi:hypothetical protein